MENNNPTKQTEQVPNPNSDAAAPPGEEQGQGGHGSESTLPPPPSSQPSRTPFTNLSQVDADLALARALQDQERAYMMLRMNNNEGSEYGSWEAGSYLRDDEDDDFSDTHDPTDADGEDEFDGTDVEDEEDAFDVHAHEDGGEGNNHTIQFDPDVYSSDEAYARALQDAEDREMASRLLALAGINDREDEYTEGEENEDEDDEDHGGVSLDRWEEVDPDELSYEELIALGEVVGTENRGLSADTIASLPSVKYKTENSQTGSDDPCVICRLDYEDDDTLTVLSCKHSYHSECILNWLKINKVCPVCSAEVSSTTGS